MDVELIDGSSIHVGPTWCVLRIALITLCPQDNDLLMTDQTIERSLIEADLAGGPAPMTIGL